MTTTSKKKSVLKLLLSLIAVIALCASLFYINATHEANAKEDWSAIVLEENYAYGSTIEIPSRTIKVGGENVKAWHTVTYPDGKTVNQSKIKLDVMGDYTVNYFAEKNGKQYGDSIKFTVKGVAYRFTGEKSSATYGAYTKFGANSVGLNVRLAYKETLEFTHLIDVSNATSVDNLVKGFITPDVRGAYDFTKLIFVFTDSEDESVYLRFHINKYPSATSGLASLFVSAGGNGQDMVGYENEDPGKNPHVNDNLGQYINGSFVAQKNGGGNSWSGPAEDYVPDSSPFTLAYDASTLTVTTQSRFISTLNDPKYYTKALWHGFPSGKVRLSVSASGYASETANFCLMSVAGLASSDLKENIFTDKEGPVITVDNEYTEMPNAEVGKYYPIPQATAYDVISGKSEVNVRVYTNYGTENQVSVGIENGKFKTNKLGYYVIEYSAADVYGNVSKKMLYVYSVLKIDDMEMVMPLNPVTATTLGNVVDFDSASVSGGSGNVAVKITAKCGNNVYEIENNQFRFETAGEYTITYTATDYIGKSVSQSYTLTASAGDKPMFVDDIDVPRIFISDSSFTLPEYYVNDYTGGSLKRTLCSVKVKDANGEKTYKSGSSFVPKVNNNGDYVTLVYFSGSTEKEVKVPAIIAKYGDNRIYMNNYIYGDVTTSTKDENNKLYTEGIAVFPSKSERSGWLFANALSTDFANFTIKTVNGKSGFNAMEIVAYDRYNANCGVKVTFEIKGNSITAKHGGNSVTFAADIIGKETTFYLTANKITFECGNVSVGMDLTEYENGEAFNGFSSGRIYVGMNTLNNADGDMYFVNYVCGKMLSYRNRDITTPTIQLVGDNGGRMDKGAIYTIKRVLFGGIFAPETTCSVTVYAPNGSIATDVNGLSLKDVATDKEYYIKLNEYGSYRITYTATDVDWVNEESGLLIDEVYVPDTSAPVITITSGGVTEVTVGSVIAIPTFTVKDNVTPSENISVSVFVITSAGRVIPLGECDSFKAEYTGTYKFVIYAVDAEGNVATAEHAVQVK